MRPALLALVFVGGGIGSVLRYLVGLAVLRHTASPFPFGTFAVNVLGCFLAGLVGTLAVERAAIPPEARVFLMVGVLGGFTTFSAFAWETLALGSSREDALWLLYALGSVAAGLSGAFLGRVVARLAA